MGLHRALAVTAVIPLQDGNARVPRAEGHVSPHLLEVGAALVFGDKERLFFALPSRQGIYVRQPDNALVPWCKPAARPHGWRPRPRSLAGIGVACNGEIWLTDAANHCILRLDPVTRLLDTVAGTRAGSVDGPAAEARLRQPGLLAMASDGSAFVEQGSTWLRRVLRDGNVATLDAYATPHDPAVFGSVAWGEPRGLAIDDRGRLLVFDAGARAVVRLEAGSVPETIAQLPPIVRRWDPNRDDYPVEREMDEVRPVEGSALAVDRAGTLYVADAQNPRIWKIGPDGGCEVFAGRAGRGLADRQGEMALFDRPVALAVQADGTLVVSDSGNHRLRSIDREGRVSTFAGGPAGDVDGPLDQARFMAPGALAIAPDGAIWLIDAHCRVCRIDTRGMVETVYRVPFAIDRSSEAGEPPFDGPLRLVSAPNDTLYSLEPRHNRIRRIDADGRATVIFWWQPNLATQNEMGIALDDLAVDGNGNVFAIDGWNGCILSIEPDGTIATVARYQGARKARMPGVDRSMSDDRVAGAAGLWLAAVGNNTFYVADSTRDCIMQVTPRANALLAGGLGGSTDGRGAAARFNFFQSLAYDGQGTLFCVSGLVVRWIVLDGMTGTLCEADGGYTDETGQGKSNCWPAGLALEPRGGLVFLDFQSQVIVRLSRKALKSAMAERQRSSDAAAAPMLHRVEDLLGSELQRIERPERSGVVNLFTDRGWLQVAMAEVSCPCCFGFKIVHEPEDGDRVPVFYANWQPAKITGLMTSFDAADPRVSLHYLTCAGGYTLQVPGKPVSLQDDLQVTYEQPSWARLAGRQLEDARPLTENSVEVLCHGLSLPMATRPIAGALRWSRIRPYYSEQDDVPVDALGGAVVEHVHVAYELTGPVPTVRLVLELDDGFNVELWDASGPVEFRGAG